MFNLYSEDYAAIFYNIIGGQNTQMTCYQRWDQVTHVQVILMFSKIHHGIIIKRLGIK